MQGTPSFFITHTKMYSRNRLRHKFVPLTENSEIKELSGSLQSTLNLLVFLPPSIRNKGNHFRNISGNTQNVCVCMCVYISICLEGEKILQRRKIKIELIGLKDIQATDRLILNSWITFQCPVLFLTSSQGRVKELPIFHERQDLERQVMVILLQDHLTTNSENLIFRLSNNFRDVDFGKWFVFLHLTMESFCGKRNLMYTHKRFIQKKCCKGEKQDKRQHHHHKQTWARNKKYNQTSSDAGKALL